MGVSYIAASGWLELLDSSVGGLLGKVLDLGLAENDEGLWALWVAVVGLEHIRLLDHEENLTDKVVSWTNTTHRDDLVQTSDDTHQPPNHTMADARFCSSSR